MGQDWLGSPKRLEPFVFGRLTMSPLQGCRHCVPTFSPPAGKAPSQPQVLIKAEEQTEFHLIP